MNKEQLFEEWKRQKYLLSAGSANQQIADWWLEKLDTYADAKLEKIALDMEKLQCLDKICAYCHDTGMMSVKKMRGNGYENKWCVWCREGKDKLGTDQLVCLHTEENMVIKEMAEFIRLNKTKTHLAVASVSP